MHPVPAIPAPLAPGLAPALAFALALALALALAAASTGCSSADRWDRPDPSEHPREAIADIFRSSLAAHPDAPRPEEARVVTVTAEGVVWEPITERAVLPARRALRFADIIDVGWHEEAVFGRGVAPEAILVYVRGDPKVVAAAGAAWQLPGEVDMPLAHPYVALRRRPPGSYRRLVAALGALGFTPTRY